MRFAFAIACATSALAALSAPSWAGDLTTALTGGPMGKGAWTQMGGSCRRPDLTFSRGSFGLTVRFASADEDGSRSGFSTATAEGELANFTLRYDQIDPGTMQMQAVTLTGRIDGSRLTLTDAEGGRRVYTACDGDAPARSWEME
jgi:hypothetical protein